MNKPIKKKYRISVRLKHDPLVGPAGVFVESCKFNEWSGEWSEHWREEGTDHSESRYSYDWGWHDVNWTKPFNFASGEVAKTYIMEQLEKYKADLAEYDVWMEGEPERERLRLEAEAAEEARVKALLEKDLDGQVFE